MTSDLNRIKIALDSEIGKPLKDFLIRSLNDLRDIDNIKEYSKAQDQALEVKSQKKAYNKLKSILSEIMIIGELDDHEDENEYAVV